MAPTAHPCATTEEHSTRQIAQPQPWGKHQHVPSSHRRAALCHQHKGRCWRWPGLSSQCLARNGQHQPASLTHTTPPPAAASAAPPPQHCWPLDASESTKPTNTAPAQRSPFNNNKNPTGRLGHANRNVLATNRNSRCTTYACAGAGDAPSPDLTAASASHTRLSRGTLSAAARAYFIQRAPELHGE